MQASSLIGAMLFATTPVHAQSTDQATANAGPAWLVSCSNRANPKALTCTMAQSVFFQKQPRQRIVKANILRHAKGGFIMRLQLPHGLDLTHGVSLTIDEGKPAQHPIRTADANGAYSPIPLDDRMLAAMKAGSILVVGVRGSNGNEINLQMSLAGFSDAFGLMTK